MKRSSITFTLCMLLLTACTGPVISMHPAPITPSPAIRPLFSFVSSPGASALFPTTKDGRLHFGQVFEWGIQDTYAEVGRVDVVWGAARGGSVRRGQYFAFGMYSIDQLISGWIDEHPSWIEYQCDRQTRADIPGSSPYVIPLDFTNPAVRQFIFNTAWEPVLANGYDIDLDDTLARNITGACGHYTSGGIWVQQFSGAEYDESYNLAVIAATAAWAAMIHQFSDQRALVIDTQALPQNLADTIALGEAADMVLDETGVTQWGWITPQVWYAQTQLALALSAKGKCVWMIDDEGPGQSPTSPTPTQRLYDVANYYLTLGVCSYLTINDVPGYGHLLSYRATETTMNIGLPLDNATQQPDGAWVRHFSGATVTVSPQNQNATIVAR